MHAGVIQNPTKDRVSCGGVAALSCVFGLIMLNF